jgi:hypothetical protein
MNGDHAEYERENANVPPEERSDWPLPSFDAMDWAKAFCKIANGFGFKDAEGRPLDEGWMVSWFANALMRGFDERAVEIHDLSNRLDKAVLTIRDWHTAALAMRDMAIDGKCDRIDDFYFNTAMKLPFYGAQGKPLPSETH